MRTVYWSVGVITATCIYLTPEKPTQVPDDVTLEWASEQIRGQIIGQARSAVAGLWELGQTAIELDRLTGARAMDSLVYRVVSLAQVESFSVRVREAAPGDAAPPSGGIEGGAAEQGAG